MLTAFFFVTPTTRNVLLRDNEPQKSLSMCGYDSRSTTEFNEEGEGDKPVTGSPKMDRSKFSEGAPIGAENVGRMLFLDGILKSGRGDVRVGATVRWKDFKGTEIIRNSDPEAK